MRPTPAAMPRLAGLDGLRALAVTLVVIYHLFPGWMLPGGFIGVDIFFVISGFLITTLLLREHAATGGIRLRAFWQRRARRLLPALALVVTVCTSTAWLIGGDVLVGVGRQVLGAATFSYNWLALSGATGYFAEGSPELFKNLWSLAVEEQFYLLWPLILPLFLLIPRRGGRAGAAVLLAGVSAAWMASVIAAGGDPTRAYFGTDTHAFGLLLGVALAFALSRLTCPAVPGISATPAQTAPVVVPPAGTGVGAGAGIAAGAGEPRARLVRTVLGVAGAAAVAGLVGVATIPADESVAAFPGVLLAASALTVVAILGAVWPGSHLGRVLDTPVLAWIGNRSYGIYLWHWPLLVLVTAWLQPAGTAVGAGILTLALTLLFAQASYQWLEQPIRRYGFRAALGRLRRGLGASPRRRFATISALTAGALVLGGTSAAIAAAPQVSSSEAVVQAGADVLVRAQQTLTDADAGSTDETPDDEAPPPTSAAEALGVETRGVETAPEADEPNDGADERPGGDESRGDRPLPDVAGDQITAIGDSVMLASAPSLLAEFPGIHVDAAVSRSTYAGPGIMRDLAARGTLRPIVVVALGTNGPVSFDALSEMARIAGPDRTLVLVNAHGPRDWIPGVNADLASFAASHENIVIADWDRAIAGSPDKLAGDQIHPERPGGDVFADCVDGAIDEAAAEQRRREDLQELGEWKDANRTEHRQKAV